MILDFRRT